MPGFARWIITVTLGVAMVPAGAGEASPRSGPFDQEGYVESADGVRLYYRTIGAGGDAIVVVHGGPGLDSGYLAPDLDPLAASHVLIAYDQRGSGRCTLVSDAESLHIAFLK